MAYGQDLGRVRYQQNTLEISGREHIRLTVTLWHGPMLKEPLMDGDIVAHSSQKKDVFANHLKIYRTSLWNPGIKTQGRAVLPGLQRLILLISTLIRSFRCGKSMRHLNSTQGRQLILSPPHYDSACCGQGFVEENKRST